MDAGIDHNFVSLAPLAFFDPKPMLDPFLLIQEMMGFQLQQIGDAQCSVDPYYKKQQVSKALLSAQYVFDLSDLFSVTNGFDKVHKIL